MRKIIFIFLSLLFCLLIHGQKKIVFDYDKSGNREKRTVINLTKSAKAVHEIITEQVEEREIKVYPNPTQGQIKVEISNNADINTCTITINSLGSGRLITRKKATFPTTEIDLSNQPNGFYIMVINIDGKIVSWKIIKQ